MILQIAGILKRLKKSKSIKQAQEDIKMYEPIEKRLRELVPKAEEMERSTEMEIPESKRKIKELQAKIRALDGDIGKVSMRACQR